MGTREAYSATAHFFRGYTLQCPPDRREGMSCHHQCRRCLEETDHPAWYPCQDDSLPWCDPLPNAFPSLPRSGLGCYYRAGVWLPRAFCWRRCLRYWCAGKQGDDGRCGLHARGVSASAYVSAGGCGFSNTPALPTVFTCTIYIWYCTTYSCTLHTAVCRIS